MNESKHDKIQRTILSAIMAADGLSAAQLSKETGFGSGTLYPHLARLERDGFITSGWADEPYPRRRLYRIARKETT
jgi:DNA-binding PadR family transcriptional regulator